MNRLMVIILCCLAACNAEAGKRWAVVVGINDYQPQSRAELPDLQYAARDADVLGAALKALGFSETVLTTTTSGATDAAPSAVTAAKIRSTVAELLTQPTMRRDDMVIVSLHGHGVQFATAPDDQTPKFYFCPADANLTGIQTAADVTKANHLIPLDELYATLGRCRAATKILVVDACRNDPTRPAIFRSGMASATLPRLPAPQGGLIALFSCKQDEWAVEDSTLMQGVFSHFLVEGLLGRADQPFLGRDPDGVVTLQELAAYVSHQTRTFVKDSYGGLQQTPVMKGSFDANLPLFRVSSFDHLSPNELIALHGGKIGGGIDMEFIRVEGGDFDYTRGFRAIHVPTMFLGRYEVTVGQYRKFTQATGYETIAELAGAGDFVTLKSRGYKLGKGEMRNGAYEFGLGELFGAGLSANSTTMTRSREFSWKNPGWPQTDDHPVINLTAQDMFAFEEWLQRTSYRDVRIAKEHELVWVCYGERQPKTPTKREKEEYERWVKAGPPRVTEYDTNMLQYKPAAGLPRLYGQRDNLISHGTLPVTWQRLAKGEIGGLFCNAVECSENPFVDHDLCIHSRGVCLPRLHAPMVAGFRMVIPVPETSHEVHVASKKFSHPPKQSSDETARLDRRKQLEQAALTSFALASYFRGNTPENRRLGGVIHSDYPTSILAPSGSSSCDVWKSADGQFVYVSRDNETLRFRANQVRMLPPIQ